MRKRHLAITIAAVLATGSAAAQEALDLHRLNGLNGFVINGVDSTDQSGSSVSGAGDINNDGIDDILIGAPGTNSLRGESYVVFGNAGGFPATLNLSQLNGNNGFALPGVDDLDFSGGAVSSAGDINSDDIDDLIIGAPIASAISGQSYVVYGSDNSFQPSINLSSLPSSRGFVFTGVNPDDRSGRSVSDAEDINGDGIDDLIIGAYQASPNGLFSGAAYVVFGKINDFSASEDLAELNGSNGFIVNGLNGGDIAGVSVSGAGDFNGDGMGDIIIGASGAGPNNEGEAYVVFGFDNSAVSTINLLGLNGTNGLVLTGANPSDRSGLSVHGAGDFNSDGIDDVIISAPRANSGLPPRNNAGAAYVVFGNNSGFSANLNLGNLDGNNGFVINGIEANEEIGDSVSGVRDINGDGFDDVIIGGKKVSPVILTEGQSYVVFGFDDATVSSFDLSRIDGRNGFVLNGIDMADLSGESVSGAGDVNDDGIADLIIGAPLADPKGNSSGEAYVVFGNAAPTALGSQTLLFEELEDNVGTQGSRLDFSVSAQYIDNDAFGGMAVVADASTGAQGQWEYSDDGLNWASVPDTLSDNSALVLSAEALLRFVPVANFSGRPGALTARFWDGRWREPGENINITTAIGALGGFARDEDLLQVTLDITPVNDAPSFTAANPPTVNEDPGGVAVSGWSSFNPGPGEAGQFALTYQVENISNPGLFSVLPTIGTLGNLIYNPAPDASGISTFDVRVVDSGGMANGGVNVSGFQSFTITVNPVNDPPAILADDPPAVTIDSGAQTVLQWVSIDAGALDEQNQQVTLSVGEIANASLFSTPPTIDESGNLTYTPARGVSGISTFTVTARDNGGTASGGQDTSTPMEFTIRVNAELLFSDSFEG